MQFVGLTEALVVVLQSYLPIPGEDLVQCVPAKKGHQILYKGYTYVFKTRLQCGSEQWCCTYRQKTGCISLINMQTNGVEVVRDFHNHKKPMFTD